MDIKAMRKLYGMSQSQFAERFGLSVRTLQQWEQHKSEPPQAMLNMLYELYVRENEDAVYEVLYKDKIVDEIVFAKNKRYVFVLRKKAGRFQQPFMMNPITTTDVYTFFKSRCYEDCRADLKDILAQANLDSNDPYRWVAVTHGVTWEDFFWVRRKNEQITWNEVKVRE